MYEEYFGLKRPPFKITPDTSLFYEGGNRGDILGALVYAVQRGEGIVKVVGEVGSGKTMLCRMLQLKLPASVEIIYIANPSVSAQDILFVIAHELNLSIDKSASKHEVMHMLQDYLLQRHMEAKQVVLFIEEAQCMPLDTLEEIRLLSNLETDQNKLLQIILFGQPELDDNLSEQSIRQLRERITHNFNLQPLSSAEIHNYLNFRMREVGYTGPELIDPKLAKKVEQYSGGLLRRINIIADKVLLSAFAESTHDLSSKHVVAAVNDSGFEQDHQSSGMAMWAVLLIVVLVGAAAYMTQHLWMPMDVSISGEILDKKSGIETKITEKSEESMGAGNNVSEPVIVPQLAVIDDQESLALQVEPVPEKAEPLPIQSVESEVTVEVVSESVPDKQVTVSETVENKKEIVTNGQYPDLTEDNNQWLNTRLLRSREWLSRAKRDGYSIQVLVRRSSATSDLVYYLRNEWPLDLEKTYLYEVITEKNNFYRVFYSEFESVAKGKREMARLPDSVKANSPYLQSVSQMQKTLL